MALGVLSVLGVVLAQVLHTRILFPHPYPWTDLYIYQYSFTHFGTKAFYEPGPAHESGYTYPNTIALFYWVYYAVPHPLFAFFLTIGAAVGAAVTAFARQLIQRGFAPKMAWAFAVTMAATSYPLWFLVEGANLEIFVVVAVGLGLAAFLSKRYWWAAALFGIATSLKYFPIILFGLLFSRKHYKQFLFGLGVAASYFLFCNWVVGPTLAEALKGGSGSLSGYTLYYVNGIRAREIGYDHSLYSVVKHVYLVMQTLAGGPLKHKLGEVYKVYLEIASATAVVLYFARIKKVPPLSQVLAIVCLMLLLPPVSFDYRLCHLYVPWAFLVFWMVDGGIRAEQNGKKFLALFALLFTPQTFLLYWIGKYGVVFSVTYGAQIKTFSLLAVLALVAIYPVGDGEPEHETKAAEVDLTVLQSTPEVVLDPA